jgi:DNA-binding NarL/FixJ family response regulator
MKTVAPKNRKKHNRKMLTSTQPPTDVFSAPAEPETGRLARSALVVEDEPMFQTVVACAFAQLADDWVLVPAATGRAALEAFQSPGARFDLILVDLGLPDMGGIDVIRAMRQTNPSTPILVLSVRDDESHVLGAIRAGAFGYLLKNEPTGAIAYAIHQAVEGEYPISPSLARHLFRLATGPQTAEPPETAFNLAPKELELIKLLAKGHSYKKCALLMNVSLSTIQTYIRRIYQKLDANCKVQAVAKAREQGWLC